MIEHLLREYGYLIVYFGTLFEPDATLVTASFMAHRGYMNLTLVFIIATLSTMSMSHFWFWLARSRGRESTEKAAKGNGRYARVRRWVERNVDVLVFFSRFLWGLRIAIASACGASGVRPIRFIVVDTAGAIAWTAIIGTVGYSIAHAIGRFFQSLRRHEDVIALGLLGAIALFALWKQVEAVEELKDLTHPEQLGLDALSHVDRRVAHQSPPETASSAEPLSAR